MGKELPQQKRRDIFGVDESLSRTGGHCIVDEGNQGPVHELSAVVCDLQVLDDPLAGGDLVRVFPQQDILALHDN